MGFLMMMAGSSQVTGPSRKDVVAALSQPGNDEYLYNNDLLVCLIRKAEIGAAETGWHGGWRGMLDAFTIETIDNMVSDEQAWELDESEYVPRDLDYENNPHPQSRTNTYGGGCEDDNDNEYYDAEEDRYDEEYDNEDYYEGGIVYYDSSRGFGFILDADDERIYFHVSQFGENGYMRFALDFNWDEIRDHHDGYAPVYFRYVWNEERDEWHANNVRWNDGSE